MPHGLYTPKNIRKPRVCNPVNFHVHIHCVKSVRIQSYSGPHFPRITPNTDTFYAVILCADNGFNKKIPHHLEHLLYFQKELLKTVFQKFKN